MNTKVYTVIAPAPRHEWRTLINRDPYALPYQTPEWIDAACQTGGYVDASRLYEMEEGKQKLILPLVHKKRVSTSMSPAASMPDSWGIGGVIAAVPLTPDHLRIVFSDLTSLKYLHTHIRPNPLVSKIWQSATSPGITSMRRRSHILDLEGGFSKVWSERFSSKTRGGVRKAEKSQLVVECDTTGRLISAFYEVLEKSVVRWAEQQNEPLVLARWRFHRRDPLSKFKVITDIMGDKCRVWVAWLDGRPVATSIRLVVNGGNANAIRAASIKEKAAPVRANDLLMKLAIEDACNSGCRYFGMGESGNSIGISKYKERFGGVAYPYHEYNIDRWHLKRIEMKVKSIIKKAIGFRDDDTM